MTEETRAPVTFSYDAEVLNCPYCGANANPDVPCPGCFNVASMKQMLGHDPLEGKTSVGRPRCTHSAQSRSKRTGRCLKCK